ncbi:hypothetical protein BTUL_0149g00090 [Botrytis tulipae]|uniref:Uncharacterized protein n=1 Tax=Botrytis tulipae TaxID=87230 RepID=A0A4Z1EKW7_9HELO|nr:hypothetical protein BTUL_0149g00090 [Botrytis tulipae]
MYIYPVHHGLWTMDYTVESQVTMRVAGIFKTPTAFGSSRSCVLNKDSHYMQEHDGMRKILIYPTPSEPNPPIRYQTKFLGTGNPRPHISLHVTTPSHETEN